MDKTALVREVTELFRMNGHTVENSVRINNREIDVVARELQGIVQKTLLIECADYGEPVGVGKIQDDFNKLNAARESLKEAVVLVHVSRRGYTQDAGGYALGKNLSIFTYENLVTNLVNFEPYIKAIEADRLRPIIIKEYQPTTISAEGANTGKVPALNFFDKWRKGTSSCLIVLGDYGVGKSWLLKRHLYELLDQYKNDKTKSPLPFFVPLQKFTKAFDFQNLILKTFESYSLSGVHYASFQHLVRTGRVILLLDSFDEMAQNLGPSVIRENISTIFEALSGESKAIITSRPNYFENKAERILLVERFDISSLHGLDKAVVEQQIRLTTDIRKKLDRTDFARLDDLTPDQRTRLFKIVLDGKPSAFAKLTQLLKRFGELETLSQRAVIARLLTTVAETLAEEREIATLDGEPLLPADIEKLNQAKIFDIVVHNLLARDEGIGRLSANDRYRFLKRFAIFLQRKGSDFFATPDELRDLVRQLFNSHLDRSDTPEQDLENFYRTCRRHSGLTTEGQFYDTSGVIDLPVSEMDSDSRVGFSHNSLREYLVAASIADAASSEASISADLLSARTTDLVKQFVVDIADYKDSLPSQLSQHYVSAVDSKIIDYLFEIIAAFIRKDRSKNLSLLGKPPHFRGVDISLFDLSEVSLAEANIENCIVQDTAFAKCDLRSANFGGSIIEGAKFDGASWSSQAFMDTLTRRLAQARGAAYVQSVESVGYPSDL